MKGIVYKSTGSWYEVKAEDGVFYNCRIQGRFRLGGIRSTNPVAVGDRVVFKIDSKGEENTGIITAIKPRDNYIIRRAVNLARESHIIAANVDTAFLLVTLNNPVTFPIFIDRFLVTAEAYGIRAVLLFNKSDSYNEDELNEINELTDLYESVGYTCLQLSALTGMNLEKLKELMKGKVSVFAGHSGTGKSTLVNKLEPGLDLKTSEISERHLQGQHTTTFAQMFDLSFGGKIIDTPGIRGFGLVAMEREEIGDYFPEFLELKSECRFNNCLHLNEPQCAVKKAVEEKRVSGSRYRSYLQILEEETTQTYRRDLYEDL